MANHFYLERLSMLDNSFQLFQIIRTGKFAIQVDRYLAIFTQIFPLVGTKLNLELETIAKLHTLSFPIIYGICFIIIAFIFKNKRIALTFLLYHFLIVSHSFFWPQCELVQGVSWFLVYVAYMEWIRIKKNPSNWVYLSAALFILSLVFMHPLIALVHTYYYLFVLIEKRLDAKLIFYNLFLCLLFLLFKVFFFENSYDSVFSDKLSSFISNFSNEMIGVKLVEVFERIFINYKFLSLIFISVCIYLILNRKWLPLLLLTSYSFGLILLKTICYNVEMDLFYSEVQYNLVAFFAICMIVEYILLPIAWPTEFLILPLVFSLFFYRVFHISEIYTNRLMFLQDLTHMYQTKKVLIRAGEREYNKLKLVWGSSFETWLISTLQTGVSSSIIISDNPDKYKEQMKEVNVWLTEWETIDYKSLNPKYFNFTDTTSSYKLYANNK